MRALIFIIVAIVLLKNTGVGQTNYFIDSPDVANLFLRVDTIGKSNMSSNVKIAYGFFIRTNETTTIQLPKPEFYCQMQLLDDSGMVEPKTLAGEKYGSRFLELNRYSVESVNLRGYNTGGRPKLDIVFPQTDVAQGYELPAVQELFAIKKLGAYKLLLQFQVFKMVENGASNTFQVGRLPVVEIPVVKNDNK